MNIIKKTSTVILLMAIFVAVNVFGDVCSANSIDTCKVKAGKNGKGDSIKFSGLLDAQEADFIAAIGGTVIVIIEADDIPDLNATTYMFPIEEDTLKKGKYKSTKVKSIDKSDPVTSFKIDTIKGKMKFSGKNLDLTGLSCPITVTIQIGDYAAEIVLDEDIVNGPKKPCPPELIVGAEDTISAAFSFSPGSPMVEETVAFTDNSSGAPTSWLWDFGDGGASTEQHPTHIFTEANSFTVTLTASDGSSSDSVSHELTVDVDGDIDNDGDTDFEPTDWTEETHSKSADPNFSEVFDNSQVKRFDIVVTSERWQNMLDDMTDLYGTFGENSGGGGLLDVEDPMFVPAEIFYNDIQWYRVGIRFKGNSSLQSSWKSGILKLSFKLDFDEYEDDYPQIKNQRFYGFKKFSLKNNYDDKSFLREKVSCDIFEDAGLAVSHTAFYELYVDHGDGPEYFGLYTLVEEVDNTVIKTQFSDDDGNLYKPEDTGASFEDGTFNEIDFEKKTNEDDEDWTDIQALFAALHDDTRILNPVLWRTNLELVFDTDVFLKYLAINTVIQNWDQYGRMTQNYYLYNNPDTGKLTWIPWDYNEALQDGKQGGGLELDFSDLASGDWPLIAHLYSDDVYRAVYDEFVEEIIEGVFATDTIQATYANYETLIEPYATSERTGYTFLDRSSDFQQAISALNQHAAGRASAVDDYLNH